MPDWFQAILLCIFTLFGGVLLRIVIEWLARDEVSVYLERDQLRKLKADLEEKRRRIAPLCSNEIYEAALAHLRTYLKEQAAMSKVTGVYFADSDFYSQQPATVIVDIDSPAPSPFGTTINLQWFQGDDPPVPVLSDSPGSWLPSSLSTVHIAAGQTEGQSTGTLGNSPGQGTPGNVHAQDDNAQFLWAD